MKRYHFDDLTQINVPFGLLDDDTQERLKAWPHGTEKFWDCKWAEQRRPYWISGNVYRAKPAPLTKPHVPDDVWRVLPDWVAGVAQDESNMEIVAHADPHKHSASGGYWVSSMSIIITEFKGVTPGTCDWRDSWVPRPEGL